MTKKHWGIAATTLLAVLATCEVMYARNGIVSAYLHAGEDHPLLWLAESPEWVVVSVLLLVMGVPVFAETVLWDRSESAAVLILVGLAIAIGVVFLCVILPARGGISWIRVPGSSWQLPIPG